VTVDLFARGPAPRHRTAALRRRSLLVLAAPVACSNRTGPAVTLSHPVMSAAMFVPESGTRYGVPTKPTS
jgi:hypothetical protein